MPEMHSIAVLYKHQITQSNNSFGTSMMISLGGLSFIQSFYLKIARENCKWAWDIQTYQYMRNTAYIHMV